MRASLEIGHGGSGELTVHEASQTQPLIIQSFFAKWDKQRMALLLLEALGALLILVFIVWWTMFSGRKGGELPRDDAPESLSKEGKDDKKDTAVTGKEDKI